MRRAALVLALFLSACPDDGSGSAEVDGIVTSVGPVSNASVEIHAAGDNGAPQRLLGSTTTATDGSFSLSVPGYSGWTIVKAWGGTYVDAASGSNATIPQATPLLGVAETNAPEPAIVSRATTMLTMDAQQMARDPGLPFAHAILNAALKMQAITGVPDVHRTVPANLLQGPTSAGPRAAYGALLAGYSEYAFNLGVSGPELGYAAALDATDGKFDGLQYFDPVPLNLSTNLSPGFLTFLWIFTQAWLAGNPNNLSGLDAADLPELSAISSAANTMPVTPRIQSVWNGHSTLAGGTTVTVRGWGFGTAPELFVGTTPVPANSASDTEVTFDTPALGVAGDYDFTLRASFGYTYTSRLALRYYDEDAAPTVTGATPNEGGMTGGTPVKITGGNLDPATRVFFGSTEALVVGGTFPREIWAISPKVTAPLSVDLRVQNGSGQSLTLAAGYEYKRSGVGRRFDDDDFEGGAFTAIYQKWDYAGTDFQARVGTTVWNFGAAGQGTFSRRDMTMLGGSMTETTTNGVAYVTAEGASAQVATFDSGTNASNLYAFTLHPDGNLGAGLTAGGTTAVFRHGVGLSASTLFGKYGVSGSFVNFTPELTFGTGAGTIEFDGQGAGGINLKVFERQGEDTGFRQYTLTLPVTYDVSSDGALDVEIDPGSATSWDLQGRVTSDGGFASFYYAGTGAWQGRSASFKVVRLEPGIAPEDYRGEYDGGFMSEKTYDDDGDFVPKVTAYLSGRILEVVGAESRHFAANDGGSLLPGPIDRIYQTGRVSDRIAGQYGRVEYADGAVGGYMAPKLGVTVGVGRVSETVLGTSFDDRLVYGFDVRFDAHYSKWSISGPHNLLSWSSRWIDPAATFTGDEANETSIGSVTFNPSKPVTIGGDPFLSFGGFDGYSASSKFVSRIGMSVSASFGPATDYDADFAYGFVGDRYHHVIGERDETGPLGEFRVGFTLGKGALSPSGSLGGYGSTSGFDRTSYTAFAPQLSWTIGPSYRWGSALWDFDPTTGATLGRMERGTLSVSGMMLSQNYMQRLFTEGSAATSSSSSSRTGSFVQHPNGTADFVLGTQLFGGIAVGNADMFILTDFSGNNQTGIQVLTRNAASAPPLFDYGLATFTKLFLSTTLPAQTLLSTRGGTFTPQSNFFAYAALDQGRSNDSPMTGLGRQFNTGQASTDATGGYSETLGSAISTGGIAPNGLFGYSLPGPSTDAPTAMSLGIRISF